MSEDSPSLFDVEIEPRTDPSQPVRMRAVARVSDPVTSLEAATSIKDLKTTQKHILEVLDRYGPATDEEINRYYFHLAQLFDWNPVSPSGLRTRRAELVDAGFIYDTGKRQLTKSNRPCIVWELKESELRKHL